jgi:hypothetical protein
MRHKRRAAQLAAAEKHRAAAGARMAARACAADETARASGRAKAPESAPERDVTPWLRALGFNAAEARRAAVACDALPGATLEERVRFSLSLLKPPHRRLGASGMAAS